MVEAEQVAVLVGDELAEEPFRERFGDGVEVDAALGRVGVAEPRCRQRLESPRRGASGETLGGPVGAGVADRAVDVRYGVGGGCGDEQGDHGGDDEALHSDLRVCVAVRGVYLGNTVAASFSPRTLTR